MAKEETIMRFRYLANLDKERHITAWIKVTDPNVNAKNALAYLVVDSPKSETV